MNGGKITGLGNGTAGTDAVNKDQLDAAAQGQKFKDPVRAASTGNVALTGIPATGNADDITLIAGDRFLVWQNTAPAENGIYVVAAGAWSRSTDMDADAEIQGSQFQCSEGTLYALWLFRNTNSTEPTVGVTGITFTNVAPGVLHNETSGKQGGTTDEYYHFTSAQHSPLATLAPSLSGLTTQYRLLMANGAGILTEISSIVTDASGNLGVGVAPTLGKLHVADDVYVTGDVTLDDIMVITNYLEVKTAISNGSTYFDVKGDGTGNGFQRIYDNSNNFLQMYCAGGIAFLDTNGPGAGVMHLQGGAHANVDVFNFAAEGETPAFEVVGFRTGDIQRRLSIGISAAAADTALFAGVSNYQFNGDIAVTGTVDGLDISALNTVDVAYNNGHDHLDTLQDVISHLWSPGSSDPSYGDYAITENGDGTIDITAGSSVLRSTNSADGDLRGYALPAVTGMTFTDEATNYIVADYNSGTPALLSTDSLALVFGDNRVSIIYAVNRLGNQLNIIDLRGFNVDFIHKNNLKDSQVHGTEHASGAMIADEGTQNFSVTAGSYYLLNTALATPALDTSVAGIFEYVYRDGASGWTRVASQSQIDIVNYDDDSGTLAALGNAKFGVHFLYAVLNTPSHYKVIYGTESYATLSDAQAAGTPAELPSDLDALSTAEFIGKIIIQKSTVAFVDIQSPYTQALTSASASTHNALAGLQGGVATEYYHLDSAEHTAAVQGVFAEIHCHDAAAAQSIASGATYTKVTAFTDNGFAANCTPDQANDKITITVPGIYRVEGSFSFIGDSNAVNWKGSPFLNGVEQDNVHWQRKVGTGTDLGNASFTGFIDVPTVPVDLDFRMAHDNGTAENVTISYGNINTQRIGTT